MTSLIAITALIASSFVPAVASPQSGISLELPQLEGASFNDLSCEPSNGSNPVVFLHGTSRFVEDWKAASNFLADLGYCTYAFNYGDFSGRAGYGWDDLDISAKDVEIGIANILNKTGADKVSLIGHSQGGMMIKKYIEQLGHADKVDRVVTFGASYGGTDFNGSRGLRGLFDTAPALWKGIVSVASFQQVIGNAGETPQVSKLKALKDTSPGIIYTPVYSPNDTVVTDYGMEDSEYGKNSPSVLQGKEGWVVNVNADEACGYVANKAHDDFPYSTEPMKLMAWGLSRTVDMTEPVCGADAEERIPAPILSGDQVIKAGETGTVEITNLNQLGTNTSISVAGDVLGWRITQGEGKTLVLDPEDGKETGQWVDIPVEVTVAGKAPSQHTVRVLAMPASDSIPEAEIVVEPPMLYPKQAGALGIANLEELPEGTTLELAAEAAEDWALVNVDGSYVLTPTENVDGGEHNVLFDVVYPDGSTAEASVDVTVNIPVHTTTETTTETETEVETTTETTTVTEPAEKVTETVTETAEPVTETVTETPEAVTETETVTETPEVVTETETPEPTTVTVTPDPATKTVTETETVVESSETTVTQTEKVIEPTTIRETTTVTETPTETITVTAGAGSSDSGSSGSSSGSSSDGTSPDDTAGGSSEESKPWIIALATILPVIGILAGIVSFLGLEPRYWNARINGLLNR